MKVLAKQIPLWRWALVPILLPAVLGAVTACNRPQPPTAQVQPVVASPLNPQLELPDVAGFVAGELIHDAAAVRRTYRRGEARVSVTLARLPMNAEAYQRWVDTSVQAFPQADLDLPPGEGNGFYQCSDTPPSCDLLIQLRVGIHLELRSAGTASRKDVDDLVAKLPLRRLVGAVATKSFKKDIAPVLSETCATSIGCHGERRTQKVELDLRLANSYRSLVNRTSMVRSGALLVDPGHAARSFLVDKLTRALRDGEGRPMPLDPETGAILTPSPIETFVWQTLIPWIVRGAPED